MDFLDRGILISTADKRAADPHLVKPNKLTLSRSSIIDKSRIVDYEIIDDVTQLSLTDWNRVVAVFVSGSTWQFEGWPKQRWSNPAAIFESIAAFHLYYDDEILNQNIIGWKLHRLCLSRSHRHADRALALEFWNILTEHIMSRQNKYKLNI